MKIYISLLSDAQLVQLLYVPDKGINSLNKPEKIYLNNSNLMYNLGEENVNIGNIRETFFYQSRLGFRNVELILTIAMALGPIIHFLSTL